MIKLFTEIKKEDIGIAGGKGANLGELTNFGFNVPNGFVVTTSAYDTFLEKNKLKTIILDNLSKLDVEDNKKLEKTSSEIKKIIIKKEVSEKLEKEINKSLKKLKGGKFAVRSSATAEDLITASFAGQQDSFLNISSKDVIDAVRKCWASLFNSRAIYYRNQKKIGNNVSMAVVVQEMIDADFAGVVFTVDPIRKKYILVEAATGLGEKVVSGSITPSSFMLQRKSFEIIEKNINYNIDEEIVKKIGKIGLEIEKHYNKPQDIEFAVKGKEIFILQSRAITTL
jgi:pyruvate, water dikinase